MLNRIHFHRVLMVYVSIGVIGVFLFLQSSMASAASTPETDGSMEILTRGPIHEAFAEVSVDEAQPGAVVSARPVPDPIEEIPPEFRPEGDHVEWISGYWSWDEDQNDFIWVSGIWRDVPPGRQWIPGYWTPVEGGNQYISGFWTAANQAETVYLPPPPAPLQAGPSSPSLSPYHVWINGHWLWFHGRYAWQAGYWLYQKPDMVWIPSRYVWSPRGYIFVLGYWDYQFARRGVIFAPRYYSRPIYRNHGYYYTPSIVLNIDTIFLSLFIRRDSHHYYFGDYFDNRYERRGFHPWYSKHATRYGYDPFYRSYRQHHMRKDSQWERKYHQQFKYRYDHKEARPPAIYRHQTNSKFARSNDQANKMIGRRFNDVVERKDQPLRFTRLNSVNKRQFQEQSHKLNTFQVKRRELERVQDTKKNSRKPDVLKQPVQLKMPSTTTKAIPGKSPVFQKQREKTNENRQGRVQDQSRYQSQTKRQEIQYQKKQNQTEVQLKAKPQTKQHSKFHEQTAVSTHSQPQRIKYQKPQQQTEVQLQAKPRGKPLKKQDPTKRPPRNLPQEIKYQKPHDPNEIAPQLPGNQTERQPRAKQQWKQNFQRHEQSER